MDRLKTIFNEQLQLQKKISNTDCDKPDYKAVYNNMVVYARSIEELEENVINKIEEEEYWSNYYLWGIVWKNL